MRASADAGIVTLKKLHGLSAAKVLDLATRLVEALRAQRGTSMRQVGEAFANVVTSPREVRLKEALIKLLLDGSELSDMPSASAAERRLDFFREAARARREGVFDRDALLAGHGIGSSADDVEHALYSDLPEHRILLRPSALEAKTLVEELDTAQARALLLSARSLTVFVPRGSLRRLVWRAKFLGLIPSAQDRGDESAVTLEGPAAKFETSARYGLAFANFFPELEALPSYRLEAQVHLNRVSRGTFTWQGGTKMTEAEQPPARDAVLALAAALRPFFDEVSVANAILVGQSGQLVVPDLTLIRGTRRVHLELLEDANAELVRTRVDGWPADARDLIVAWKVPQKAREPSAQPPWLFIYRRILATKLLAAHSARFFD